MSVRFKILGVAVILLGLFAATTMLSTSMIYRVNREIGGIVSYHIPLAANVSELDVLTSEYELNLHRVLLTPAGLPDVITRHTNTRAKITAIFSTSDALLDKAMQDEANDVADRIVLAEIDGAFTRMSRQGVLFLAIGDRALSAIKQGRPDDARRELAGFTPYYDVFGDDLADIRRKLARLSATSLSETEGQASRIIRVNGLLFLLATAVGLGVFALFSFELYRAFHRLIDGARKVEGGELTLQIPVTSKDELGQLTEAFNKMTAELRSKEQIRDTFGKFVDPRIVATLLSGQAANTPLAERRSATIFFSDIKRFTSISELLTADTIVRLLNAYFTSMTQIVQAHKGIVDKYIGDAVMAFWTRPFCPNEEHAAEACLAALAQQEALVEFRKHIPDLTGLRRNAPDFRVRIGLATGDAVVGTIGSEAVRSYTVIGDTVNVAARLEGANKVYGTSILASEETIRTAGGAVESREIDQVVVAGKTEPLRIFELLSPSGQLPKPAAQLNDLYAEALLHYRKADWDAAEAKFRQCLELCPADGPSQTFLTRVPVLRATPPAAGWTGAWDLTASGPWAAS